MLMVGSMEAIEKENGMLSLIVDADGLLKIKDLQQYNDGKSFTIDQSSIVTLLTLIYLPILSLQQIRFEIRAPV